MKISIKSYLQNRIHFLFMNHSQVMKEAEDFTSVYTLLLLLLFGGGDEYEQFYFHQTIQVTHISIILTIFSSYLFSTISSQVNIDIKYEKYWCFKGLGQVKHFVIHKISKENMAIAITWIDFCLPSKYVKADTQLCPC